MANNEKVKLEEAIKKLEKIVGELNSDQIDVENGLAKFREGVELIKFCRGELGKAENEFQKLKSELEPEPNEESEL